MPRLTCDQARRIDHFAMETLGIPGLVLMENAGRSAACLLLDLAKSRGVAQPEVALVCGGGNNGGDGYVAARHLVRRGIDVTLYAVGKPREGTDAKTHADIAHRLAVPIVPIPDEVALHRAADAWARADILVDALLGTGFRHPVRPFTSHVITRINATPGPTVVAFDLPSGFDGDHGHRGGEAVRANMTITFAAEKVGFSLPRAEEHLGQVVVADIGVPERVIEEALKVE